MKVSEEHKKRKSFIARLIKLLAIVIGSFAALFIVAFIVFYFYRDQLSEELILRFNKAQKGEISFSSVSLSPFVHFPSMSLRLTDIYYSAEFSNDSINTIDTIANIKKLYVAIDVTDLISGDVNVSSLTISGASVFLKRNEDSILNFVNAIGPAFPDSVQVDSLDDNESIDETLFESGANILLEKIHLKNLQVNYLKVGEKDPIQTEFENVHAFLKYEQGIIEGEVDIRGHVQNFVLFGSSVIQGLDVELKSTFAFDEILNTIEMSEGNLKIDDADFKMSGNAIFNDDPMIDLTLSGQDKDLSFFGLWLSDTGLENMKSGKTFFSGTIKGSLKDRLPRMTFDFGIKDVSISLPDINHQISDLNMEGLFKSGEASDFSEANLSLKKFSGKLPGGSVNASFMMEDFTRPKINLMLDLTADITGFDEIFKMNGLSGLSGRVDVHDKLIGEYIISTGEFVEEVSESSFNFDSVSFDVPDFLAFRNICGRLNRRMDIVKIENLSLFAGNSDFIIDGKIMNWLSLLEDSDAQIVSELQIRSDTFDLPDFCSFDPSVRRNFPYRIIDIDLAVNAFTTREKLFEFYSNPEIEFSIQRLNAEIENLFPPVIIHNGNMVLGEKEKRVHLVFNNFDLDIVNSNISADVIFFSPQQDPDYVFVDAEIDGLNPSSLFYDESDSIPGFFNGILNGKIVTEIEVGLDSLVFESVSVKSSQLDYTTAKDTIDIRNLDLIGNNVYYKGGNSPFASLSSKINFRVSEIISNHFHIEDIFYDIHAVDGEYTIIPEKIQIFGKEGEGVFVLRPFEDPATYALKYQVSDFRVESFLSSLMADTLINGLMNLEMDVVLTEIEEGKPISGINGYIRVYGSEMMLYGLDLDNLIRKFQRSQNFSLVDVGAVVLAGPFGLAITKGSEFANLAFGDYGDTTSIKKLVSEWECVNGKLILEDVAFTTDENRVACLGWIDMASDSLDVTFSVLDKYGCSILSQSISGNLKELEYSEMKIVKTILAPITNLIDGALGKDCEVFYHGKLEHPPRKRNKQ